MRKLSRFLAVWGVIALVTSTLRAVIVVGGDGTQNVTAPSDNPGWDNVGSLNGATGVYLGSYSSGYWVLTATHVGFGNITLAGNSYSAVPGSGVQVGGDLYAFRIGADPQLANLTLSAVAPTVGAATLLIGNGLNRAPALTTWYIDVNTTPFTWSTTLFPAADTSVQGYFYGSGNSKRWGTNVIEGASTYNLGNGNTTTLVVDFDADGDAQGAPGDSGGAMFYKNGSTWELAGILGAIGTFNGQPGSTAVANNITHAINLSAYNPALSAAIGIPEPATWAPLLGGVALATAVVARRRRL